jgi:NAD(P)-dependent dehydrogenase (short-subunit alcohol dehydrogenase family)
MPSSVLVTGASGGLGEAVARRLVADGWRVVATVRHNAPGGGDGPIASGSTTTGPTTASTADQAGTAGGSPGVLVPVSADVTDEADVAAAVRVAAGGVGAPLRAVVNLVGGFASGPRVHEMAVADFEAQFRLNLRSAYLVSAAALPHLVAAGGGSVVCVSSRAALRPFAGAAGYITAKAALLAFVDVLAVEYRDERVRANAVLPSVIDTAANRAAQPQADHSRWVAPEQIADLIAYLCSDASAATSGAHIPACGRA